MSKEIVWKLSDLPELRKTCHKCKEEKPITEFSIDRSTPDGHRYQCRSCCKEGKTDYNKRYYQEHKEKIKARTTMYYLGHRDVQLVKKRSRGRITRDKLKVEVLTHYGHGKLACVLCSESRIACLSLDHINGDGAEHRRRLGLGRKAIYSWLRKEGFPVGYQTLCMNCQFIKREESSDRRSG